MGCNDTGLAFILSPDPPQRSDLRVRAPAKEEYDRRRRFLSGKKACINQSAKIKTSGGEKHVLLATVCAIEASVPEGPTCATSIVSPGMDSRTSSKPFHPTIGCARALPPATPLPLRAASPPSPTFRTAPFCATHWTRRTLMGAYPEYT